MSTENQTDAAIAAFTDHASAEAAVNKLTALGFDIKKLSVVGKGYHTEEKVLGFYNTGDRVKFWGSRGIFWGGLWGLFFGGLFVTTPVLGPVFVVGYLAAVAATTIESALIVGGVSAIGAALYSIGIPRDSVVQYDALIKADRFLVMAHGTRAEIARARLSLESSNPETLDVHSGLHSSRDLAA